MVISVLSVQLTSKLPIVCVVHAVKCISWAVDLSSMKLSNVFEPDISTYHVPAQVIWRVLYVLPPHKNQVTADDGQFITKVALVPSIVAVEFTWIQSKYPVIVPDQKSTVGADVTAIYGKDKSYPLQSNTHAVIDRDLKLHGTCVSIQSSCNVYVPDVLLFILTAPNDPQFVVMVCVHVPANVTQDQKLKYGSI